MLKAVVFDFGGVIAEEGFRQGLHAIARRNGLDPGHFFRCVRELIYETGYVTGALEEHAFWTIVREKTKISGGDGELREEILSRFVLRPAMVEEVERLRSSGLIVALLSDQTNWLDEIEQRTPFYHLFDKVYNSFKLGKSKRDPSVFVDTFSALGILPPEALFVDDSAENIENALSTGCMAIHFLSIDDFRWQLKDYIRIPCHRRSIRRPPPWSP
ncbi:MAG: HAD family phosphatase [Alphaproteobacteria bacterium]|uniref:HAD family phosphatase n=1 Tax=Candidatus Nitrobium versatile TaxID=2884831 RepID=A0A953M0J1_9BACT|nr:HAD family phosphatase [Candidatus Nitrobium versatile]